MTFVTLALGAVMLQPLRAVREQIAQLQLAEPGQRQVEAAELQLALSTVGRQSSLRSPRCRKSRSGSSPATCSSWRAAISSAPTASKRSVSTYLVGAFAARGWPCRADVGRHLAEAAPDLIAI
jgi:hypothetical protein